METVNTFFRSMADDIRHQEENHFHCLTGFYNFSTNESFYITEISLMNLDNPVNNNIEIKVDNINDYIYDKKDKKYEYFKNSIRNFLFLNMNKLKYHWLTKDISFLTTENFNNFFIKVVLTKIINKEKTNNSQNSDQYEINYNLQKSDPYKINYNLQKSDPYEKKYNKYKNKYLELKNQLGGWTCMCGANYSNNLICCQQCNRLDFRILEHRLRKYGLSQELITIINRNITDINTVILSDQEVETNISTLPQLNFQWTKLYSEPIIDQLELFIIFIYVVNYYQRIGQNIGNISQIHNTCRQITQTFYKINMDIMQLANIVQQNLNDPILIATLSVPIDQLVNSKNNNILFDGAPYNYYNQFQFIMNPYPIQFKTQCNIELRRPFDVNKFRNNTWRNEILFKHIFIHYGAHNGMKWETINILENFARKINNINNIWKYEILQFIHSYLHVLDGLNYDVINRIHLDPIHGRNTGHIPELNICRATLRNNPNHVQIRTRIEQAFNFNCSHYLLKDINSMYYHNPYYIKTNFISEKRRQYDEAVDLNTLVVPEPAILPPNAPTTAISFCLGMVPRN